MDKLIDTAKKLDGAFKIAHTVLSALAVACGVFIILIPLGYFLGWDADVIGTGYDHLDIGFLELEVREGFAPDKWVVLLHAGVMLAMGTALILVGRYGIRCVRVILEPMTQGQPFSEVASVELKKLALVGLVVGIGFNIMELAEQLIVTYVYDVPALLVGEKIAQVTGNFTVDVSFLVYCAILLLLSYIFRYGAQLQQLSDETL